MAEIVWTEPAVADLEAIADYIALESPSAASGLVERVVGHIKQLQAHPESGSRPRELGSRTRYRQIVEPPCRIFYRFDGTHVFVVHVMRTERLLRRSALRQQKPKT
ncbi:MAG TPA: type II toxin-antitoxin system RelE/ParE family toxin [Thauera sp.]|nr:type II toxin-antitoxin system RelE/ParE family toxin [Thauera sp.]